MKIPSILSGYLCAAVVLSLLQLFDDQSVLLHAPLVVIIALFPRDSRAYMPVAFFAMVALVLPLLWLGESPLQQQSRVISSLCVLFPLLMGLARRRRLAVKRMRDDQPTTAEIDMEDDFEVGVSIHASAFHTDPANQPIPFVQQKVDQLLEQYQRSNRFSIRQLEIIHQGLEEVLGCSSTIRTFEKYPEGTKIGSYSVVRLLGHGGAGQVYLTQSPQSECVALKILTNTQFSERFQREMELVQRLAHPNIVIGYDVGEYEDSPFIAMEYMSGGDLRAHVKSVGPFDWKQSVDMIRQAALGLQHAHERGLIHRDVKPGNLLWDAHSNVKIGDLGLAALVNAKLDGKSSPEDQETDSFNTIANLVAGTPDFMSPEQAKSLTSASIRSDVFSLGATWFFLLTGESRVVGSNVTKKLKNLINGRRLADLPADALPDSLATVWRQMTAHDPADRYESMQQVIDALDEACPDLVPERANTLEVLIVEDDHDDLFVTIELLRKANSSVNVHAAHSLQQAIETVHEQPDLNIILLDLELSDSTGVATVQRLRAISDEIPIVVLTGHDDLHLGQECIHAGADEFACKNDLNAHQLERVLFITQSRVASRFSSTGL